MTNGGRSLQALVVLSRVLGKAGSLSGLGNSEGFLRTVTGRPIDNVVTARSLRLSGVRGSTSKGFRGCYFRVSLKASIACACGVRGNITEGRGTAFLLGGVLRGC